VQVLTGALTFLLPVTIGGGPAGNRRLTEILEFAWRSRAVLGNAGVLGLATLPQVADAGVGDDTRRVPCPGVTFL
jgi:hypothetical protein